MSDSRNIIGFFKSKPGATVIFIVLLIAGLGVASQWTAKKEKKPAAKAEETAPSSEVQADPMETESYQVSRDFAPALDDPNAQRALLARQAEELRQKAQPPKQEKPKPPKRLPIAILTKPPVKEESRSEGREPAAGPAPLVNPKDAFAPYGRMLQCELVTTVDSSNISTPVVGLVTRDLYWNRKLLIPANSEVHAIAQADRSRNRIAVEGRWAVVLAKGGIYPEGSELMLDGVALDMDKAPDGSTFGLTDGSAGLRGTVLTNEDGLNTIKLFTATFLAGAADGVTDRETNAFGQSQVVPSLRSGALQGSREVMERYAQRILDLIERDGAYVRVPSGKQFYVYIRQPVLMRDAKLGATLAEREVNQPDPEIAAKQARLEERRQEIEATRAEIMRRFAEESEARNRSAVAGATSPNPPSKP
jgi:hypothetical protein